MLQREWWEIRLRNLDPAWKFSLGAYLIARVAWTAWSLGIALLFPVVVQNLDLFGAPAMVAFDLGSSARYAFSREVSDAVLTFRAGDPGYAVDTQTRSVWSLRDGRAVSGHYAGWQLAASAYPVEDIFPYRGVAPETNALLALWQRFDVNWYLAIAARGYGTLDGDVHFPPLYPALIRMFGAMLGGNHFLAALLISNVALIAALVVFYRMVRDLFGAITASRAVAYLLIFPTAFFFFSAYSEPLFLLTALLALRTMQQRVWLWSGFWSFCAILLRLQGIALFLPLAYAVWRARPFDKKIVRAFAFALPAGALVFYLLIRALVGDPSIVPLAETNLHARLAPPWDNYISAVQTFASGRFISADVLNLVVTTLCVVILIVGWRRLPVVFDLYAAASLVILTMRLVETQPLNSMSRYVLTLFPVFIVLGQWGENPWARRAIVYSWFALAFYLSAQFVMWGWVG